MIQGPIDILTNSAEVVALVGINAANTKPKIYWVVAPENEVAPYVVLQVLSNAPAQHKGESSSMDNVQFAALVYGDSPEAVDELDIAIRAALEVNNITAGGYFFNRIYFDTQSDGYDNGRFLPFRATTYRAIVQRMIPT